MITRETRTKVIVFLITLALGAGLFVWILNKTGRAETWMTLQSFGLLPFFGFVVLSLLNFVLLSWRWKLIIDRHLPDETPITLWSIARHRMSGFAMSYLTPSAQIGGEPLRIALLHQDGVPLKPATSSVLLDVAFEITGFIVYITFGLVLSLFLHLLPDDVKWTIGSGILLIGGILVVFFTSIIFKKGFLSKILGWFIPTHRHVTSRLLQATKDVEDLMGGFLRAQPRLAFFVFLISCITVAFRAIEIGYLAFFFGVHLSVINMILLSTLPGLALLVPIPSGLGVLEGSTAGIMTLLGLSLNAIALVLIIRARDVIFILLGVMHLGERLKTWLQKKELESKHKNKRTEKTRLV